MQAFPKDSANNLLGGSGPVHKNIDFAQFHGHGAEGFTDYSNSGIHHISGEPELYLGSSAIPMRNSPGARPGIDRTSSFNPRNKVEQVHGNESMGLGTSTFLEGAPASRVAMKRRESESDQQNGAPGTGGLSRKKSLVQKIKGISNPNRGAGVTGKVTSPIPIYDRKNSPTIQTDVQTLGAGEMRRTNERKETNPFFNDYDEAYERKGATIQIASEQYGTRESGRSRALSSPKRSAMGGVLERRVTNDGTGMNDGESKNGGFLSRVKSLKGGRRARPTVGPA